MLKQARPLVLHAKSVAWAAAMLGFLSGSIVQADEPSPKTESPLPAPAAVTEPIPGATTTARGQGHITAGSTLLGVWLTHVIASIVPIAMDSARDRARGMPCRGDLCYVRSIIGYATMGAATVVFAIPGAITLGVGVSERRSSSPPRITRKYGTSPTQPSALAPLDFSVTPYASSSDFGLMATGRF